MGFGQEFSEGRSASDWIARFLAESEIPDIEDFCRTGIYLLVILSIVVGAAVVTDAIVVTDLHGTMIDMNQMCVDKFWFFDRSEAVGRSVYDFMPPAAGKVFMATVDGAIRERGA